jgi:CheY-like chemotaxis protein
MKLPIYAHPTVTVLVDDHSSFLQNLPVQPHARRIFHRSDEALAWMLESPQHARAPLRVNHDLPACSVTVDVEGIFRICSQRGRFSVPSVLVVDFYMPRMNGLDFCRALQYLPCKKILLAGPAEERLAMEAMNDGLIDRYVRKQDADAPLQLERQIAQMQQAWFLDQERVAHDLLAMHEYSFLQCRRVAEVVRQLYLRHGFVEHYVFPQPNGILLIDGAGAPQLMVVETEAGMQAQYEIARDSGAPLSLLQALEQRQVLPFFNHAGHDGMYDKAVGGNWQRYCQPPQVCQGDETYYWALFGMPNSYLREQPYTHAQYMREALTAA